MNESSMQYQCTNNIFCVPEKPGWPTTFADTVCATRAHYVKHTMENVLDSTFLFQCDEWLCVCVSLTCRRSRPQPCSAVGCSPWRPARSHWPRSPPERTDTDSYSSQQRNAAPSWKRDKSYMITIFLLLDSFNLFYHCAAGNLEENINPRLL